MWDNLRDLVSFMVLLAMASMVAQASMLGRGLTCQPQSLTSNPKRANAELEPELPPQLREPRLRKQAEKYIRGWLEGMFEPKS